jgi:preprotein translocase subunit SecY
MIEKLSKYIPVVEKPRVSLSFVEKFKWLIIIISAYAFLSNVPLIGVSPFFSQDPLTYYFQLLLGAKLGSILTLGIAPLISAAIVLHILVTGKILNIDLKEPEGRKKYESYEKVLTIFFAIVEAFAIIASGYLPIIPGFHLLVFIQIIVGVIILLILDSLTKKYAFGSIINIAIFTSVASQLIVLLFSPFSISSDGKLILWFEENKEPSGYIFKLINSLIEKDLYKFISSFIPIISTIFIILLVTYIFECEVKVGALEFKIYRGFKQPFNLKLLYVSILPLIFAFSFIALFNFAISGTFNEIKGDLRCGVFGCVDSANRPVSGIIYYLSPPSPIYLSDYREIIRAIIFFAFLLSLAIPFGYMWVYAGGMDASTVAKNIVESGMTISGLRDNPQIIENYLNNFIPHLTFISIFIIVSIAVLAELLGALGGGGAGISLVLLVSIAYSFYQSFKREKSEKVPKVLEPILKE